jgi:hypothetical protein
MHHICPICHYIGGGTYKCEEHGIVIREGNDDGICKGGNKMDKDKEYILLIPDDMNVKTRRTNMVNEVVLVEKGFFKIAPTAVINYKDEYYKKFDQGTGGKP